MVEANPPRLRFGIVGLGRIGGNLARQALERGHVVVGFNRSIDRTRALESAGLEPALQIEELKARLARPRIVFIYVPHGAPTEQVCQALAEVLESGDVVIDGGNSHWTESQRRCAFFAEREIRFLDVGTSGGVTAARHGACFMAGGDRAAYDVVAPVLRELAVHPDAVFHAGPSGAGHFVKLVHNAIEFGMIQAIAEGVELLDHADFPLDLPAILNNWQHGSVIRSWLIELMRNALREHADLAKLSTYVEDTGEVKWVLAWALERDIPTPVVSDAQAALMQYRDVDSTAARCVALLRNQFGEHPLHHSA